jgi:2',3'-cyclic-nucleotide 2'-phosphodiesterase / 3'-nucleotidase / 5'-nucleotidase
VNHRRILPTAIGIVLTATVAPAQELPIPSDLISGPGIGNSSEPTQLAGSTASTVGGWNVKPLFTVGEAIRGYRPVGILDGIGALALNSRTVRFFVNHELNPSSGYLYSLANGTQLRGARVSYFDVDRSTRRLIGAGPAFHTVVDRAGAIVTSANQINEGASLTDGFDRFCSSSLFHAGEFGLVDDIYFTGEEGTNGQEFALDVQTGILHGVPMLGRAAWENVTLLNTGNPGTVGIIGGDDRQGAPLWLYLGYKNALGDGSFLDRNGLASGTLWAWVSDSGDIDPEDFHGTGESRTGSFVEIIQYDAAMAGQAGYDALGYANQATLDAQVNAVGGFHFARPEDISTNPADDTEFVLASTGRGNAYPSDNWGTVYVVNVDFGATITASVDIVYAGDDAGAGQFAGPDFGLRSPDNLDWSDNGLIYLQEDRATTPESLFGATSGAEASVWELDPQTGVLRRILEMDRGALPTGQSDSSPADIGNWESSGVLDVTEYFHHASGELLLMVDTQAHSLLGESLGGPNQGLDLVQGGQLMLVSRLTDAPPVADESIVIAEAALAQNEPNPFNPSTSIRFNLPRATVASLRVYNVRGELVRTLADGFLPAGEHEVEWDGQTDRGGNASSGVYYYRLETQNADVMKRMTLLK